MHAPHSLSSAPNGRLQVTARLHQHCTAPRLLLLLLLVIATRMHRSAAQQ
jgi:hypothetical protein